jgi:DNA repair protein RadC
MENQKIPINFWSEDDRPREKLLTKGKTALTDAELLAILINSGNRNESAVDLCRRILQDNANSLPELARLSEKQLMTYKGIGEAIALSIVAALELGQRRRMREVTVSQKITCSKDVFEMMQPRVGELSHEEFWVILLSNANRVRKIVKSRDMLIEERFTSQKVIDTLNISKGGMTGTVLDLRILFKLALEYQATAVILVHNHPSGKLKPSHADIQLTKKVVEAGKIMDIMILDHFIITEFDYFSFADNGLI